MHKQWLHLFIALVGCGSWTSLQAEYGVVLGSFTQRDIAVRELRELGPSPSPLFIAVAQPASGTYYRVIAGPYGHYGDAADALVMWQGRGLTDAWIKQMVVPSQAAGDLAEDESP